MTQIFGLKTEKKYFFVIQIPVTKIIGKSAIWTIFCFWVSPPNYINWAFMFLMQQSHVQWCVLWNLLCNANNFVLLEQNLENKDFASPNQIFKLLAWAPKIVKTIRHSDVMGNCLSSKWFKPTNCKILHLIFSDVFQTISDKNYGKNYYLGNFMFLPPSPF